MVSAFTVGHSLTLIGAAMGFGPDALWFPALVELLIAGSNCFKRCSIIFSTSRVFSRMASRVSDDSTVFFKFLIMLARMIICVLLYFSYRVCLKDDLLWNLPFAVTILETCLVLSGKFLEIVSRL